jgi:hypothetical protein
MLNAYSFHDVITVMSKSYLYIMGNLDIPVPFRDELILSISTGILHTYAFLEQTNGFGD